ncbi:MAG: M67 family metallopeptidase [Planctomycetota bacterium]
MQLPHETRARLVAEAEAADPHECCGVLLAEGTAIACENVAEEKHHRFAIDPLMMLRLDRAHRIVGIYHSHPDAEPVPSATDLAAAWPGYVYSIIGRIDGAWVIRSWALRDGEFVEIT